MVPLFKSLGHSLPTRNFQTLKCEQGWNVVEDKADYLLHVVGHVLTWGLMHPLFVSSGYTTTHTWENLVEHN
ncbi:hypothetical protein CROQUDRAFT_667172 [Cronartium quercuum f. sp. fusiforme G11]|uniref:Uncharacterized protein n=1 Tax=Cronartium quercuum f. sp. fusiforme G11 TaxID=708437 RepID=A0A9P6T4V6_9BASI|nr:hypothetical protein CROQUDRAFT_667172 [Cronartium quercuum f. sp. fusiforme G11]